MSMPLENTVIETLNQPATSSTEKPTESKELNELFGALAKAQMEMEIASKDSKNPFFKSTYADFSSIILASRPYLSKNGICIIQRIVPNEKEESVLYTRMGHTSGQWMESSISVIPVKPKKNDAGRTIGEERTGDIQAFGSRLTYLRRYMYMSMVGIVCSDDDDDGNAAAKADNNMRSRPSTISRAQLDVISNELRGYPQLTEAVLKGYQISKLSDLPNAKYSTCLEGIKTKKLAIEAKGGN